MRTITPRHAHLIPPAAKLAFKGIMYDVYHWPQKLFDGSTATFEMLRRQDSIKVVAVKDGKLVLVEDEQPTHAKRLTFPGGRHDVDTETELDCAKREMLEETGMTFTGWKLIGIRQPNDEMDWLIYVFLASGFDSQREQHIDGGERIAVKLLDYNEVMALSAGPTHPTRAFVFELLQQAGSVDGFLKMTEYAGQ